VAVYIAFANGNLSDAAGTWDTVDATSFLNSDAANTALTTAYVESQTFVPGAITIDAIAVFVNARAASPAGTISVRLAQAGVLVAGTEVTINVSDIDRNTSSLHYPGWYLFKFAAPVLLVAATAYSVSAKTSSAAMVNLNRNATAGNWSRMLRTTTAGNPGAGDEWHVLGEWTAAATKTNRTIAMDEVAAVDYGAASTSLNLQSVTIGKGGTLAFNNAGATNYVLQVSGGVRVWAGGIFTIGTVASPIPITSTATLQFDCAADGDFGLLVDGTFTAQGVARTAGKNVVAVLLNGDEAAAQTTLSIGPISGVGSADPGWLNGDVVQLGSTTRTSTQTENRVLNGNAGATTLDVTVGLTNAHSGTSPTQAVMGCVTRNVIVKSVSATAMAFCTFAPDGTVDCDWVRFTQLGATTNYKRGVQIQTVSGSATLDYCAVDAFEQYGIYLGFDGTANWNNVAVRNTVVSSVTAGVTIVAGVFAEPSTGISITLSDITVPGIGGAAGARDGFSLAESASLTYAAISNIRVSSCVGRGFAIGNFGNISGLHSNSNGSTGVEFTGTCFGYVTTLNSWRNNSFGIAIGNAAWLVLDTGQVFGNLTRNITLTTSCDYVHFKSFTIAGDTTFAVTEGIQLASGATTVASLIFENCSFGPTSGIFVAHTSEDVDYGSFKVAHAYYRDTTFASASESANSANLGGRSSIHEQRREGATNVHKTTYPQLGVVEYDTAVFRSASPSEKMSPIFASNSLTNFRLRSQVRRKPIKSGQTASVSVYVRKSAAYNGAAPRLLLLSNSAIGIDSDVVAATHSNAADTWQLLSYTTPAASEDGVVSFVVECDGTAGAAYTDDWT